MVISCWHLDVFPYIIIIIIIVIIIIIIIIIIISQTILSRMFPYVPAC